METTEIHTFNISWGREKWPLRKHTLPGGEDDHDPILNENEANEHE